MKDILINSILPKFINNSAYRDTNIIQMIQIALTITYIDADKIPLTVISTLEEPEYCTPERLAYLEDENEFKQQAQYGLVKLKLNFLISAKSFLTSMIREYIRAGRYAQEMEEPQKIIEKDQMIIDAEENAAHELAEKLTAAVCKDSLTIATIAALDKESDEFRT